MSQIMEAGVGRTRAFVETKTTNLLSEDVLHGDVGKPLSTERDEQGVAVASDLSTPIHVVAEPSLSCRMKRNQSTLVELRVSNDKAVIGDVVETQSQSLPDSQPGHGNKGEERGIVVVNPQHLPLWGG